MKVTFVVWTKDNENPVVMKKPPIQQTFLAKDVEITSFMLFLISGFLRPFLVIEKENSRVLITMICFSVLNIPIVNLFTWELKNKY
ncbi:MAG: hypothetical protein VB113_03785 [Acetobacterium wieringae]|nr:hypothetical protein [Acetobacterium wieringae]